MHEKLSASSLIRMQMGKAMKLRRKYDDSI